ncbi:MAG: hypothetical protein ACRD0G_04640 [Acidimicrobiales bacterium]
MSNTNSEAMRWHPAAGRSRARTRSVRSTGDADVIDLATERALRLLAEAGMIAAPPTGKRPVR